MACDIRLKKEKDFNLIFKKGKKIFSSKLTLYFIEEKELKVGFAVSKKHGGSVERNRIKRIFGKIPEREYSTDDLERMLRNQTFNVNRDLMLENFLLRLRDTSI